MAAPLLPWLVGPNPSDMPVQTVEYPVESLASDISIADLVDGPGFSLYRTDEVRSNDTPESLLRRLGVADPAAAAFIRSNAKARSAIIGKAGRQITAETTQSHELTTLTVRWAGDSSDVFQRFSIRKADGKFDTLTEFLPLTHGTRLSGGIIRRLAVRGHRCGQPARQRLEPDGRGVCRQDRFSPCAARR